MLKRVMAVIVGISFLLSLDLKAECSLFQRNPYPHFGEPCDFFENFWFGAEYLGWKIQDSPKVIPLVVQGPIVPSGSPVLDQPRTKVILGDEKIKNTWSSGGRFTLGYWFDEKCALGFETNYFFLLERSKTRSVFSDGSLGSHFFTVPFFDANTEEESSVTIALPGSFSGRAKLKFANFMQGAELNLVKTMPYKILTVGFIAGFRYLNYTERLSFDTNSPFVPPNPTDIYQTEDKFRTTNNFYGAQVGAQLDYNYCGFWFNVKGKVAIGAMCQTADIHGQLLTNDFDGFLLPEVFRGGYFALPTNIGHHNCTNFSVVPEANINIAYNVCDAFLLKVGYTFLYATKVLRAAKQMDRNINPTQSVEIENTPDPVLVGGRSPKRTLRTSSLWVQGINIGIGYTF